MSLALIAIPLKGLLPRSAVALPVLLALLLGACASGPVAVVRPPSYWVLEGEARGGDFTHLHQSLVQERNRLRQVDDVDVGPLAEDVAGHLGVPAVGLVSEMRASFDQLTQEVALRHVLYPSSG